MAAAASMSGRRTRFLIFSLRRARSRLRLLRARLNDTRPSPQLQAIQEKRSLKFIVRIIKRATPSPLRATSTFPVGWAAIRRAIT